MYCIPFLRVKLTLAMLPGDGAICSSIYLKYGRLEKRLFRDYLIIPNFLLSNSELNEAKLKSLLRLPAFNTVQSEIWLYYASSLSQSGLQSCVCLPRGKSSGKDWIYFCVDSLKTDATFAGISYLQIDRCFCSIDPSFYFLIFVILLKDTQDSGTQYYYLVSVTPAPLHPSTTSKQQWQTETNCIALHLKGFGLESSQRGAIHKSSVL